jgi:hypothetical protein
MKTYIAEGRVSAASLVSRDGGPWMAASDDPFCAGLIGAAQPPPLPQPAATEARASSSAAREAFLKELQGVRLKTPAFASDAAAPLAGPVRPRPPEPIAEKPAETEQQSANYLIIFELKSRGHNRPALHRRRLARPHHLDQSGAGDRRPYPAGLAAHLRRR